MNTKVATLLAQLTALTGQTLPTPTTKRDIPEWKAKSLNNRPVVRPAPDKNSTHFRSLHTDPLKVDHSRTLKGKRPNRATLPTNNERVQIGRAKRLDLTLDQYRAKFCQP